jgi:hypothetical protein
MLPKELMAPVATGHPDNGEFRRQAALLLHLIEGGDQFALGQIARRPEDHQNLGLRNAIVLKANAQGIFEQANHGGREEWMGERVTGWMGERVTG